MNDRRPFPFLPSPKNPAPFLAARALRKFRKPPFWAYGAFVALIVASWVPLVVIADRAVRHSDQPRIHLVQDMDNQVKYKSQSTSTIFADGRTMRPPVAGTVARGQLEDDDLYYRGFTIVGGTEAAPKVEFAEDFPKQLVVDEKLVERGHNRFNIYCYVCHGYDGYGNGRVQQWVAGRYSGWVQPADLHSATVVGRPDGHLYNTVSNGIRSMAGYGAQIPVADRWAIVAYVRALQLSQNAPPDSIGKQQRDEMTKAEGLRAKGQAAGAVATAGK